MADESLKDFILDQLGSEPGITARRMFSGFGLYQDTYFFGIIIKGSFYLLTDAESRERYLQRGMAPFTYEKGRRVVSMSYYEVPAEVLEARDRLVEWTRDAIRASRGRDQKRK
jgi:DNA transformation protein